MKARWALKRTNVKKRVCGFFKPIHCNSDYTSEPDQDGEIPIEGKYSESIADFFCNILVPPRMQQNANAAGLAFSNSRRSDSIKV